MIELSFHVHCIYRATLQSDSEDRIQNELFRQLPGSDASVFSIATLASRLVVRSKSLNANAVYVNT